MKNNKQNNRKNQSYKTTNGVQKLPTGTYRVRKQINGVMYSACFTKRNDAVKYLSLLIKSGKVN